MINSTAYYNDFWNEMRGKQAVTDSLYNNRESKTNAYHLPGESNKKYTAALQKESVVRQLATVVNATRSDSRLWTFDCEGQAEWGDMVNLEGMDNEDDFQRFEVQAYRLSELVRLGLEFASDQSFAIEDYVIGKMARCFGTSEEQAFINGTGENEKLQRRQIMIDKIHNAINFDLCEFILYTSINTPLVSYDIQI